MIKYKIQDVTLSFQYKKNRLRLDKIDSLATRTRLGYLISPTAVVWRPDVEDQIPKNDHRNALDLYKYFKPDKVWKKAKQKAQALIWYWNPALDVVRISNVFHTIFAPFAICILISAGDFKQRMAAIKRLLFFFYCAQNWTRIQRPVSYRGSVSVSARFRSLCRSSGSTKRMIKS